MERILIIESDGYFSAKLCYEIDAAGYLPTAAFSLEKAKQLMQADWFSLILSELQVSDGSGLELCCRAGKQKTGSGGSRLLLMAEHPAQPETERALLEALELGAEDYIAKPFGMKLLLKKIERILNSSRPQEYQDSFLSVDFLSMTAFRNGRRLPLTLNEYRILRILMSNEGKIVTRQMLLEQLWDADGNFVDDHTLTVNMTRLRSKLEDHSHRYIRTIRGIGYLWSGKGAAAGSS